MNEHTTSRRARLQRPALVTIALLLIAAATHSLQAAERPNVLIIMADDCTHNDLPLYGGQNAVTPNIDRFASQGLTFNRAYLSEAMCQPCRAELFSGQYPMRNGCAWNHAASRPTTTSIPQHLRPLGYRTGLAGKVHVKPQSVFPFTRVEGFERSCVRDPTRTHDLEPTRRFITKDDQQPFCLVIALVEPHVPWVMGDASQYPPRKLKLPPNIADTPRTRQDFARYLAEITYMDGQIGEILDLLKQTGHEDDTLVLFTSEQGAQFPGCKWTNWDTGLHTALIARLPGRIAGDKRTDALVQYADVLPTLLDAAGAPPNKRLDGTSFLPVLLGKQITHRDYVYGMHNNIPNLAPEEIYIEKHLMGVQGNGKLNNPYWASWVAEAWSNPHTYSLVKRYTRRPAEELYHTSEDPYEMTNLADSPEHAQIKSTLSAELERWMKSQGDPGALQDTTKAIQAARQGKHLYAPPKPNP